MKPSAIMYSVGGSMSALRVVSEQAQQLLCTPHDHHRPNEEAEDRGHVLNTRGVDCAIHHHRVRRVLQLRRVKPDTTGTARSARTDQHVIQAIGEVVGGHGETSNRRQFRERPEEDGEAQSEAVQEAADPLDKSPKNTHRPMAFEVLPVLSVEVGKLLPGDRVELHGQPALLASGLPPSALPVGMGMTDVTMGIRSPLLSPPSGTTIA